MTVADTLRMDEGHANESFLVADIAEKRPPCCRSSLTAVEDR